MVTSQCLGKSGRYGDQSGMLKRVCSWCLSYSIGIIDAFLQNLACGLVAICDFLRRGGSISSMVECSPSGAGFDPHTRRPLLGSPSLNGYWSMTRNQPRRRKELATLLHYAVGPGCGLRYLPIGYAHYEYATSVWFWSTSSRTCRRVPG